MRRAALVALPIIASIGGALAWAGSQGGIRAFGWPVFGLCVALAFAINALAFVPSWLARSERFYDLTGTATYLSLVGLALALGSADARAWLLAGMIAVWAIRLGLFLFTRIRASGRDPRFDAIKLDFARFLMAFMLQGLWVALTAGAAMAAMTSPAHPATPWATPAVSSAPFAASLGAYDAIGVLVWLVGLGLEITADRQKQAFRADPAHGDRFITTGLWARSRHPNYLGEIVLWIGVAWVALPALEGWRHTTLVSPVFVYVLLTRISGIPLLEARARKRWGTDPTYLAYLDRTPRLLPRVAFFDPRFWRR